MMDYLNIGLDSPVCIFDIAQAHAQLESDYNSGGWVRERPSNLRRMESTSCQLARIGYESRYRWVDIVAERDEDGDPADEDVRDIYLMNVLKWGLPIDAEMMAFIKARYVPEFVAKYPQCAGTEYLQG
jgi:hypothetical protein